MTEHKKVREIIAWAEGRSRSGITETIEIGSSGGRKETSFFLPPMSPPPPFSFNLRYLFPNTGSRSSSSSLSFLPVIRDPAKVLPEFLFTRTTFKMYPKHK